MEERKCAKCGNLAEVLYTITASAGDGESAELSLAGGACFCDTCLKKIQTFALKQKTKPPTTPRRKRIEVDEKRLIELYNDGRSYKDIGEMLGVSECVATKRCDELKRAGKIGKKPKMILDGGKVIALRNAGWSIGQIAVEMDATEEAVSAVVMKAMEAGTIRRNRTRKALEWNDDRDEKAMTQKHVHSYVTVMAEKSIYY